MIDWIIVPDLGATGGNVVVTEWLVKEDQHVKAGTPLFSVETDKATHQVEAFRDGFVRRRLVAEGETVAIGDAVAILADSLDEPIEGLVPAEIVDGSRDSSAARHVRLEKSPACGTSRRDADGAAAPGPSRTVAGQHGNASGHGSRPVPEGRPAGETLWADVADPAL